VIRRRASNAVLAVLSVTALVHAQPSATADGPAIAQGRQLFEDGRALLEAERPAEACVALAKSYALVPTIAALLNLGLCERRQGRFATALSYFRRAEEASRHDGDDERAARASDDARDMERLAGTLTVQLAASNGAEAWLDGAPLPRPAWSTPFPANSGAHQLELRRAGRVVVSTTVVVSDGTATSCELREPPLPVAAPKAPALPPTPSHATTPSDATTPRSGTDTGVHIPLASYIAGGVGLASLGVALGFGAASWGKYETADAACPPHVCATHQPLDLYAAAVRDARIANVFAAIGGAALATGVVFYFVQRHADTKRESISIVVAPSNGGVTAALRGAF
jgi:hypothetical protein